MEKPPMCLSHEEQDSIRSLGGTVDETVELSQSLYAHVMKTASSDKLKAVTTAELEAHMAAKAALKTPTLPEFTPVPLPTKVWWVLAFMAVLGPPDPRSTSRQGRSETWRCARVLC